MNYSTCKFYGDDPNGKALLSGKKLYIITTCGYPVEKGADLFIEAMKRYCKHCGLIYSGALVERQRNLKELFLTKEKVDRARAFAEEITG